MSKVAEILLSEEVGEGGTVELINEILSDFTEKEKCLYFGIPCSYGICDECGVSKCNGQE